MKKNVFEECPICFDSYICMPNLDCKHSFCYKCINIIKNCPLCRREFKSVIYSEKALAVVLESIEPKELELLLKQFSKDFLHTAFDLFVLNNNIRNVWTNNHYNQMIMMISKYSKHVRDLLLNSWVNPDFKILRLSYDKKSVSSNHKIFNFIFDKIDIGKGKEKYIHLTKTIFTDGEITMNAIQYAVNSLDLKLDILCKMFPRMPVLIAALSLKTCADKMNYHEEYEKIQDTMTYYELLNVLNMKNYILDEEVEIAFQYVKRRPSGTKKEDLVGYVNSVELIFEKLVRHKNCQFVDDKIFFFY